MNAFDEPRLRIEILNTRQVELTDLITSYQGIASEYREYVQTQSGIMVPDDVKLYVNQLRSGSIIAELVPLAPLAIPFLEHTNAVIDTISSFTVHLKRAYQFLIGKNEEAVSSEATALGKPNLQNLSNIVEPVAKDAGSQLNIGTVNFNAPVSFSLDSIQANAAQNAANRLSKTLSEPVAGTKHGVVLHWHQARNDSKSKSGDRGIIESISPRSVRVRFINDSIKAQILANADNFFRFGYVVDVSIETVDGNVVLYTVLALHDKIELD